MPKFIDGVRLATEALKCAGSKTNLIAGTDGGRVACGYAVRYMIMKAGFYTLSGVVTKQPLDNLPTGAGMASGYYGHDVGQITQGSGGINIPGNIIFWHNYNSSYASNVVIHVGICLGDGNAIDNSSDAAQIVVRPCVRSWASIIATCRLYDPSGTIAELGSNVTASGLQGAFSSIYMGDYKIPSGVNVATTSNYPEDLTNSSQNILDKEKHSSYAYLRCIGDYRIRANSEAIVRGVGKTFGGKYYIKSVRHTIERDNAYSVSVELSRNAVKDNTTTEDLKNTSPSTYNPSPPSDNTQNNTNTNNNNNNSNNYNNNLVVTTDGVYSGTTYGKDKWGTTIYP